MDVTVVDNDYDRAVMHRVMNGHAAMLDGECPDWDDTVKYPRRQWLWFSDVRDDEATPFVVVDNRDGQCFIEDFATLDGALLYLCDCHMTCEHQDDWDYMGAVKDRGGFDIKDDEPPKKFVIKAPIGVDKYGFVFGYAKAIIPHGKSEEVFTENIDDAVMFDNRHDAENAAIRLLPDSFCVKNVV